MSSISVSSVFMTKFVEQFDHTNEDDLFLLEYPLQNNSNDFIRANEILKRRGYDIRDETINNQTSLCTTLLYCSAEILRKMLQNSRNSEIKFTAELAQKKRKYSEYSEKIKDEIELEMTTTNEDVKKTVDRINLYQIVDGVDFFSHGVFDDLNKAKFAARSLYYEEPDYFNDVGIGQISLNEIDRRERMDLIWKLQEEEYEEEYEEENEEGDILV
jgi:hypothetical protein